jgi:hypothetical protein
MLLKYMPYNLEQVHTPSFIFENFHAYLRASLKVDSRGPPSRARGTAHEKVNARGDVRSVLLGGPQARE